ncbi:uncharacterized protein MONOS_5252 [Monocercomonoides exilis]|uniref:uncharacterized protein n=1 Tax=Monocercomonoides exilis TaxID=2049356 RepID=UPI00355A8DB4|nr:hypothetical protein MONOS_5252 [Monocercomonoides exilis]|eukprot:MONOS_5252.1-p1 / transcript=MONOS_5252.1 / gene=MONOS_5252 / organism=Monocercomonoides_exilis_PA203 / gene_product=unspecified product / transcript_product=unspecified product / location=Mono_scaffold00151:10671-15014(+) / protein_length=1389 / sequence_SO=supercontig / SO=protein_coding / is_pseudo=false
MSLQIISAPSFGRFAIATRDIHSGEHIIESKAISAVVYGHHAKEYCHTCFKSLKGISPYICKKCEFARYCSEECQKADTLHSSVECPTLLEWTGLKSDADTRMIIRLLTLLDQEQKSKVAHEPTVPDIGSEVLTYTPEVYQKEPHFIDVLLMAGYDEFTHNDTTHKRFIARVIEDNVSRYLTLFAAPPLLPQHYPNSTAGSLLATCDLVHLILILLCIIERNAFTIRPDKGFSVNPSASLLNHSCAPAAAFMHGSAGWKAVEGTEENMQCNLGEVEEDGETKLAERRNKKLKTDCASVEVTDDEIKLFVPKGCEISKSGKSNSVGSSFKTSVLSHKPPSVHIVCIRSVIHKNEEICINYLPLQQSQTQRRSVLLQNYRFLCSCERCVWWERRWNGWRKEEEEKEEEEEEEEKEKKREEKKRDGIKAIEDGKSCENEVEHEKEEKEKKRKYLKEKELRWWQDEAFMRWKLWGIKNTVVPDEEKSKEKYKEDKNEEDEEDKEEENEDEEKEEENEEEGEEEEGEEGEEDEGESDKESDQAEKDLKDDHQPSVTFAQTVLLSSEKKTSFQSSSSSSSDSNIAISSQQQAPEYLPKLSVERRLTQLLCPTCGFPLVLCSYDENEEANEEMLECGNCERREKTVGMGKNSGKENKPKKEKGNVDDDDDNENEENEDEEDEEDEEEEEEKEIHKKENKKRKTEKKNRHHKENKGYEENESESEENETASMNSFHSCLNLPFLPHRHSQTRHFAFVCSNPNVYSKLSQLHPLQHLEKWSNVAENAASSLGSEDFFFNGDDGLETRNSTISHDSSSLQSSSSSHSYSQKQNGSKDRYSNRNQNHRNFHGSSSGSSHSELKIEERKRAMMKVMRALTHYPETIDHPCHEGKGHSLFVENRKRKENRKFERSHKQHNYSSSRSEHDCKGFKNSQHSQRDSAFSDPSHLECAHLHSPSEIFVTRVNFLLSLIEPFTQKAINLASSVHRRDSRRNKQRKEKSEATKEEHEASGDEKNEEERAGDVTSEPSAISSYSSSSLLSSILHEQGHIYLAGPFLLSFLLSLYHTAHELDLCDALADQFETTSLADSIKECEKLLGSLDGWLGKENEVRIKGMGVMARLTKMNIEEEEEKEEKRRKKEMAKEKRRKRKEMKHFEKRKEREEGAKEENNEKAEESEASESSSTTSSLSSSSSSSSSSEKSSELFGVLLQKSSLLSTSPLSLYTRIQHLYETYSKIFSYYRVFTSISTPFSPPNSSLAFSFVFLGMIAVKKEICRLRLKRMKKGLYDDEVIKTEALEKNSENESDKNKDCLIVSEIKKETKSEKEGAYEEFGECLDISLQSCRVCSSSEYSIDVFNGMKAAAYGFQKLMIAHGMNDEALIMEMKTFIALVNQLKELQRRI